MPETPLSKDSSPNKISRHLLRRYIMAIVVGFLYIILLGMFTAMFNNP